MCVNPFWLRNPLDHKLLRAGKVLEELTEHACPVLTFLWHLPKATFGDRTQGWSAPQTRDLLVPVVSFHMHRTEVGLRTTLRTHLPTTLHRAGAPLPKPRLA